MQEIATTNHTMFMSFRLILIFLMLAASFLIIRFARRLSKYKNDQLFPEHTEGEENAKFRAKYEALRHQAALLLQNSTKSLIMNVTIIVFSLLMHAFSYGQSTYTDDQINRLAEAGKLYGYVKYFHPYMQYKNINWDSAFASHVPDILSATNKSQYQKSISELLQVLEDPMTSVIDTDTEVLTASKLSYSIHDSIMIIDLTDFNAVSKLYAETSPVIREAFEKLNTVKGVVIDFRFGKSFHKESIDIQSAVDYGLRPERHFFSSRISGPSFRNVVYKGFPGESITAERATYEVAFQQPAKLLFAGQSKKDVPTVLIVNRNSLVPVQFLAMQENSKAAIIQEDFAKDISGESVKFYLADSVLIRVRLSELINKNGTIGLRPNAVYSSSDPLSAISLAKQILLKPIKTAYDEFVTPDAPIGKIPNYTRLGTFPPLGYRALAAAKIYTIIDHFYPNKNLMTYNWDAMYKKYLPSILSSKDSVEYMQSIAEFYTHLDDGHGFINSRVDVVNPLGYNPMPFSGRMIEKELVITNILHDSAATALGVKKGDLITELDHQRPWEIVRNKSKYTAGSNEVSKIKSITEYMLMGKEGGTRTLKIKDRAGKINIVQAPTSNRLFGGGWQTNSRPRYGEAMFRLISPEIGYVDLDKLQQSNVDSMFNILRKTKAIIFDMRGHPKVTAWLITPRLTERKEVLAAKFTRITPSGPNVKSIQEVRNRAHVLSYDATLPEPKGWIYKGKTVLLIDENTMSQGEQTGLMFKAANNTTFIGSQTAGANGNVSNFIIPGRAVLWFSGLNVSYPNGETMQRIGLKPDIEVRPTIKGIQNGTDEVLDRAVRFIQSGK